MRNSFFNRSSPFFRGAALMLFVLFALLVGSYVTNTVAIPSLFRWTSPPQVTNTNMVPQSTFKAGDAFVIHYLIEREPINCWATYMNILNGPVTTQLPDTELQVLSEDRVRRHLRIFEVLPAQLPQGQYHIYQMVFPTCEGFKLRPFKLDTDIVITVTK